MALLIGTYGTARLHAMEGVTLNKNLGNYQDVKRAPRAGGGCCFGLGLVWLADSLGSCTSVFGGKATYGGGRGAVRVVVVSFSVVSTVRV